MPTFLNDALKELGVDGIFNSLAGQLRSGLSALANGLGAALRTIAGTVQSILTRGIQGALRAMQAVGSALATGIGWLGSSIAQHFRNAVSFAGRALVGVGTALVRTGVSLAGMIARGVQAAGKGLMNLISTAISSPAAAAGMVAGAISMATGALALFAGALGLIYRLGVAIAGALSKVIAVVGPIFSSIWSGISGLVSRAWNMASRGVSIVVNAVQRFWGWISQALKNAGGISGIASSIGGVLRALVGNLFTLITGVLKVGIAGSVLGAFAGAVHQAAQAAMGFAKSAHQLRATTGLSLGSSAKVLQRFGAFGVGADAVQGAFGGENAALSRMKAGAWGLPGFDSPDFIPALASRYQKGMAGDMGSQLEAQAMMKSLNLGPQFAALAMLPQDKIRGQLNYQQNLNQSLGLSPVALEKYATEIPLQIERIGMAFEGIKMKLASVMLPTIERILGAITGFVGVNADGIAQGIEKVAEFIMVKFPPMLADGLVSIMSVVVKVIDWMLGFGNMLAEGLPKWLGGAVDWVAKTMVTVADYVQKYGPIVVNGLADGLATIGSTVAGWMRDLAKFLDDMGKNSQNPLRAMLEGTAGALDKIINVLRDFGAATVVTMELFQTALAASPLAQALSGLLGNGPIKAGKNPVMAAAEFYKQNPESNIRGRLETFFKSPALPSMAKRLNSAADDLEKNMNARSAEARTRGMNAVNTVNDSLSEGASHLAPEGKANIGEQIGGMMGGYVKQAVSFGEKYLKPTADTLNQAAQMLKENVGTEEERKRTWEEDMLKQSREQTDSLRQMAQEGQAMPASSDHVAAYMLLRYAKESSAALRRQGA